MSENKQTEMLWKHGRSLQYLIRVGNFEQAASLLGINRTTLRRRIQKMEESLGCRLIETKQGKVVPTQMCLSISLALDNMQNSLNEISNVLHQNKEDKLDTVKLTMPPHVSNAIKPHIPEIFTQTEVKDLKLLVSYELSDMEYQECDIAIRISKEPPKYPLLSVISIPLHGCYCQAKNLASDTAFYALSQHESSPEPWLVQRYGQLQYLYCEDYVTQLDALAQNGIGRTIKELATIDPNIKIIGYPEDRMGFNLHLLNHASTRFDPTIKSVTTFLERVLRKVFQ